VNKKFKIGFLVAFAFPLSLTHADGVKQDIYQVQVLKDGAAFFGSAILLSTEGHWAESMQFNRKDQLKMECNGAAPPSMQMVERSRSALVAARRDANLIKVSITIKDVERQDLPASGNFEKCIPVNPNEQMTNKFDVEFLVADSAKAEFTKNLGNGYSLVLKASRVVR
jgi:hypothetical protein